MLFKALPESHSKPVICDQSITRILYTSQIYRQVVFIQQKFATIASVLTSGIRVPPSTPTPSIHAVSWKSPLRSLACGASLSRRHQDTEKSSQPERRRPRRHQQLSAMTLRQLRETQCVKMRGHRLFPLSHRLAALSHFSHRLCFHLNLRVQHC